MASSTISPPRQLSGMGPCARASSGAAWFWRLNLLAAIVLSCFLGHISVLPVAGVIASLPRLRSISCAALARTKSCYWTHLNASTTIRTVLDTVDSKTHIFLHFAGESDLERTLVKS